MTRLGQSSWAKKQQTKNQQKHHDPADGGPWCYLDKRNVANGACRSTPLQVWSAFRTSEFRNYLPHYTTGGLSHFLAVVDQIDTDDAIHSREFCDNAVRAVAIDFKNRVGIVFFAAAGEVFNVDPLARQGSGDLGQDIGHISMNDTDAFVATLGVFDVRKLTLFLILPFSR